MVRKETIQAILSPAPLLDPMKRSCEQWELEHHTTPFSRGLIVVVGERILQIGMLSEAVADVVAEVVVAAAGDGGGGGGGAGGDYGAVVVPFLVGLVAQYVLGLSPVSMKLWNYSTTLLLPISDVQLSLLGTSQTHAKSLVFSSM
jgi:hypothetical protein